MKLQREDIHPVQDMCPYFRYSDVWKFFVIYAPKCRGNNALSWLTNLPMFGYEWFSYLRRSAFICGYKAVAEEHGSFYFSTLCPSVSSSEASGKMVLQMLLLP